MQNQSNNTANFSLMPMGAQQFYQLAQQHALMNASFAPLVPGYLPLAEPESYSPLMHLGYNVPQHMVPMPNIDPLQALPESSLWAPHYGYAPMSGSNEPLLSSHAQARAYEASMSGPMATSSATVAEQQQQSDSSELISDAPFADEHKWRKYGQKQVKRSPYPRNYYKCTVAGCPAKKHLEKFWDTSVNRERCRTIYLGEHVHPVAVAPQIYASSQQDFQNSVLAQSAKIRSLTQTSASVDSDLANQQRLVVECGTEVDENEDGYFWRKYGQKSVKGSATPRQYYRCRVMNCPVKKTVEASAKGNTIVTYDGCHCHEPGFGAALDMPALPSPGAPPMRICIKLERAREHSMMTYPSATVESPSSTLSTTDEDDYLSEPSPKRAFSDDADVTYGEQIHQYVSGCPSADAWYPTWDSELLTQ